GEQAQMNDQTMHRDTLYFDQRMEQAALLQLMVGDVLVFVLKYGKARQQGVAVIGLRPHRIAAVGGMHAKGRSQRFVLGVQTDALLIAALNFLKEKQIGAQTVQTQPQVRQRFTTARCRTALMDVVTYNPNDRHGPSSAAPFTLPQCCADGCAARATASRRR